MGCCCYPEPNPDGTRNCGDVSSASACGLGGNYVEESCGLCFFVTELSSHVITQSRGDLVTEVSARPGLMIAFDFRDVILKQSELGREIVDLYRTHAKPAVETLRKHPKLLWRALSLVTKGILVAQDILREYSLKSYGVTTGALKLDQETVHEILKVSNELGKLSDTKEFDHLVSRIEQICGEMEGMNGREILDFLVREKPPTHV